MNCLFTADVIPKPTVEKVPAYNVMYTGETVSFTCNVKVATGWKYAWYKDDQDLPDTDQTIRINLDSSNMGSYSCMASRGEITETDMSDGIQQTVRGKYQASTMSKATQCLVVRCNYVPFQQGLSVVKMSCGPVDVQASLNSTPFCVHLVLIVSHISVETGYCGDAEGRQG